VHEEGLTAMQRPIIEDLPLPPAERSAWPWVTRDYQAVSPAEVGRWPKISVVTPSYNQGEFIEETIRSVLLQGYPDLEYIIVDGGSTDDTLEILMKYEPWLASWASEPDQGQTDAINKGWRTGSGEFVTWLNSDDILTPDSLQVAAKTLMARGDVDLVYGDFQEMDAQGRIVQLVGRFPFAIEEVLRYWRNPVCQPGFLMRRDLLTRIGYLDPAFHYAMDFDYWLRVGKRGRLLYIPKVLAGFRIHPEAKGSTQIATLAQENVLLVEKFFADPDLPEALRGLYKSANGKANLESANWYFWLGNARGARKCAWDAVRRAPCNLKGLALLAISFTGNNYVMKAMHRSWKFIKSLALSLMHCRSRGNGKTNDSVDEVLSANEH